MLATSRRLDRCPPAVVVLLPAAVGLLVDVSVGTGVDVAAGALYHARAVAAGTRHAGAFRTRARRERARGSSRIALALGVNGLIGTRNGARAPAAVRVAVLLRRAGDPRARVVPARVAGCSIGSPHGAAVRIAAGGWVVGRERAGAAIRAIDRAARRPRAGGGVVRGAALGHAAIGPVDGAALRPRAGRRVVVGRAGV